MIIGLAGLKGSGKDTVGRILHYHFMEDVGGISVEEFVNNYPIYHQLLDAPWQVKSFGHKLKIMAGIILNEPGFVQKWEADRAWRDEYLDAWGMTRREFVQKLGSEAGRLGVHKDIWVISLLSEYDRDVKHIGGRSVKSAEGMPYDYESWWETPNWIITDVRFINEAQAIRDRGGLVWEVIRPGVTCNDSHMSENSMKDWVYDFTINNNISIPTLSDLLKLYLKSLKLL